MTKTCRLRIARKDYDLVSQHLFPGDMDEHGLCFWRACRRMAIR